MLDAPVPVFPFLLACCHYFELAGQRTSLHRLYVDRYSGWLEIAKAKKKKRSLSHPIHYSEAMVCSVGCSPLHGD